jgi:hypothetical protein
MYSTNAHHRFNSLSIRWYQHRRQDANHILGLAERQVLADLDLLYAEMRVLVAVLIQYCSLELARLLNRTRKTIKAPATVLDNRHRQHSCRHILVQYPLNSPDREPYPRTMASNGSEDTMRAVVWEGKPFQVAVRDVPRPKIQAPEDAIIRITTAAICGSDLHIYRGFFGSSSIPYTMGHEAVGVVVETGSATETFKPGDRVVIPAFPDDGHLATEPTTNPGIVLYGAGKDFGNLGGCQCMYPGTPMKCPSKEMWHWQT